MSDNFKGPCKGCLNRYIGCHADCEPYKEWKLENEKASEQKRKNRTQYRDYNETLHALYLKKKWPRRK